MEPGEEENVSPGVSQGGGSWLVTTQLNPGEALDYLGVNLSVSVCT